MNAHLNSENFDKIILFTLAFNPNYNDITIYFLQEDKKKHKESSISTFIDLEKVNAAGVSLLFLVCSDLPDKDTHSSCTTIYNEISNESKRKIYTITVSKIFGLKK